MKKIFFIFSILFFALPIFAQEATSTIISFPAVSGGILHNDPILTEYNGEINDNFNFGIFHKLAQSFKISVNASITGFSIRGSKGFDSSGTTFTAEIRSGTITGDLLRTEQFDISIFGEYEIEPPFVDFILETPLNNLIPNTQYYLIIFPDNGSVSDELRWSVDTSGDYVDGSFWFYSDSSWSDRDPQDANFKVFGIEEGGGAVPSLFSLPMASSSDMTASVGTLFTDLWVIIALVIGIPLAFYIIQRVIALPPKAPKADYDRKYKMYNKRGEMTGYWKGK